MSNGHFGPGPEVSGHFGTNFVVPKCPVAEVSGSRRALDACVRVESRQFSTHSVSF